MYDSDEDVQDNIEYSSFSSFQDIKPINDVDETNEKFEYSSFSCYQDIKTIEDEENDPEVIIKPKIEYSELDDVCYEDLNYLDLLIEKNTDITNRTCLPPIISSSIAQQEETEVQPAQTVSSQISARPFME